MEELGIGRKTILKCTLIKRGLVVRFSAGLQHLPFLQNVRNGSAAHPASYYINTGDSPPQ